MSAPLIRFPDGLTPKTARRLADVADALTDGGLDVVELSPLSEWTLVERCDYCGWDLEAGHCYTCRPVFGYGEGRMPLPGSRAAAVAPPEEQP